MVPRILVVDDDEFIVTGIPSDLSTASPDVLLKYGIERFAFVGARSHETAIAALSAARDMGQPFDLVIVDINLHLNDESTMEVREHGLAVLEFAQKHRLAGAAIAISAWPQEVTSLIRTGAVDFIAKPYTEEELQHRIFLSWSKIIEDRSRQLIESRVHRLVPYDERSLAQRFGGCFARMVQALMHDAEAIEAQLKDRFGLDSAYDPNDGLLRRLSSLEAAVTDGRREWAQLQSTLVDDDADPQSALLAAVVQRISERLAPCLVRHATEIQTEIADSIAVLSFDNDVEMVLEEIVLGVLASEPPAQRRTIRIVASVEASQARVDVYDSCTPMSSEAIQSVNAALSIGSRSGFGREWGLSIAQHVALRGGGRIKLQALYEGNCVSYLIPQANHA